MPHLNGFQVLEELQQLEDLENIPVVATSVYTNELVMAKERGFFSFIGKPLDKETFPNLITQIIEGEEVWQT